MRRATDPRARRRTPFSSALRRLTLLLSAVALPLALAQAPKPQVPAPDVILFTNGDQLTGKLLRGVGDSIIFHSDIAGDITIPLDKIKELHSSGSFALLPKSKTPLSPKGPPVPIGTLSYSEPSKEVVITTPLGVSEGEPLEGHHSLHSDQVGYVVDAATYKSEVAQKPSLLSGWTGAVNVGATVVRSTQNSTTFTGGISAARLEPSVAWLPARNRSTFNLQETFGQLSSPVIPQTVPASANSVVRTSIFHTDFERDEYFKPRLFLLGEFSFDHNFSQGLNLQQIYGFGAGYTAIQNTRQQLDLKVDVHYEKQQFSLGAGNQNLIGSSFAETYRRNLPGKLIFNENADILPAWNNLNAYSANGTVALTLPVYKRFSANVSATNNFINNPAFGFRKNSFQFVTGLTYTLK